MQRLGKNHGGYLGETIQIGQVLGDCRLAALAYGWTIEEVQAAADLSLLTLTRPSKHSQRDKSDRNAPSNAPLNIYISTGIHGDEPAGPLAVRQLLQENLWPENLALWLCPCLNPTGSALGRRENAQGTDLNREYLHPSAFETLAHVAWLERQPRFDLCLCLHEDWESHGFYLYELNPEQRPSLADKLVAAVAAVCPIDLSENIEGRAAKGGIIRPNLDPRSRPLWPESFFLLTYKTRLSYTIEAPSDFPLPTRVAALTTAVRTALIAVTGG
jgi:hypothetical protein